MIKLNEIIDVKNCTYNWDKIKEIQEFAVLENCEQNPEWHSEGNSFIHTQLVCQSASTRAKNETMTDKERLIFLASALFHDIGKGVSTFCGKDGKWHAYGHEIEGERITRYLLWDEGIEIREAICGLVRYHMDILNAYGKRSYMEILTELSNAVYSMKMLIMLKECDIMGSKPQNKEQTDYDFLRMIELSEACRVMNIYENSNEISYHRHWGIDRHFKHFEEYKKIKNKPYISVCVLIGLPGAGKSTAIKNLIEEQTLMYDITERSLPEFRIISRDIIRAELGYCKEGEKIIGTTEQEETVTEVFNAQILDAAKNGENIVIDNMNTKRKYRTAYRELLSDYRVFWSYIYVEANGIEKNIERRKGQIAEEKFADMIRSIDWPTRDEYCTFKIMTN